MAYIDENGLLYLWGKIKDIAGDDNVIESISVNGTAQTVTSKGVNITVPTKTSDITNDSNYVADASYVHTDNNYSSSDKNKLEAIESGAEVNVIESISVNGTAATVSNKTVNITTPTNNNQLTNGAGYQTASDVSSAIATAIGGITGVTFSVVESLPASGSAGTIYLVAHSHGTNDGYDEYIWVNNAFEKLGHADVDLSGYLQTSSTITNAQIDTIINS